MGTELEQLRERMEKRLARNRESARKSREKQKTHQAQLETQLQELKNEIQAELERAQNTSGLSAAVDGNPGANADGTGGSDQPPAELVERFSVWRMTLVQAIEKVRTSLSMGETEALAQQVAEAFEVVSSLAAVWEEALRKKHYAVVFTAELFHPWERPFLWMGLLQPSDWLRLSVSKMEQGQMLQDQMKHTLETWAETFKQQEMQLSEALRQTGAQMSAVGMQAPQVPQEDQVPEVAMEQQRQMQGKLEEMVMIHRQALQLWQQAISLFRNSTAVQQAYHLLVFLEVFEGLNTVHSSLQGSGRQPS